MGFLKTLTDGYKIMGKEAQTYAVQHRAGIGTAVSIGGTIISNVLSTRAGAKSARTIDAKAMELGRPLTTSEKVKLCWTNHIAPTATATMACVGAGYSHNQHVKDFQKVATAYAGVKKLYDSAQKATREVLGEKKAAEVQDKVNQKYIEEHPEVKQKISETRVNPDPHTMQKYLEPVLGEVFYQTKDNIEAGIKAMNIEMKSLPPRNKHVAGRNGIYGVRLRRFYEYAHPGMSEEKFTSKAIMDLGFNKGKEQNGSDDDIIEVFYTPMLINDDTEACIVINWQQDPSDMAYGDYCKL